MTADELMEVLNGFAASQLRLFKQRQWGERAGAIPASQGVSTMPNKKTENQKVEDPKLPAAAPQQVVDGFEGFNDRVEGRDEPQAGGGVIQGSICKFTNEAEWVTRDGEKLPPDLELIATDIVRIVQKWLDERPVETTIVPPGERFPDVEALNAAAPKSEWREGPNGQKVGPWQMQYVVHLLDPKTMDRYSYATGTTGGGIAVRDLRDKVTWMRRLRGQVYPVVTLADKFMNTRFGGRQRPHFVIVRWISLDGSEAKALPSPTQPKLGAELNDQIPF